MGRRTQHRPRPGGSGPSTRSPARRDQDGREPERPEQCLRHRYECSDNTGKRGHPDHDGSVREGSVPPTYGQGVNHGRDAHDVSVRSAAGRLVPHVRIDPLGHRRRCGSTPWMPMQFCPIAGADSILQVMGNVSATFTGTVSVPCWSLVCSKGPSTRLGPYGENTHRINADTIT